MIVFPTKGDCQTCRTVMVQRNDAVDVLSIDSLVPDLLRLRVRLPLTPSRLMVCKEWRHKLLLLSWPLCWWLLFPLGWVNGSTETDIVGVHRWRTVEICGLNLSEFFSTCVVGCTWAVCIFWSCVFVASDLGVSTRVILLSTEPVQRVTGQSGSSVFFPSYRERFPVKAKR